jgi:hypothetical protein
MGYAESPGTIRLTLTPAQQEKIRKVTGKLTQTLELSTDELDERIAPTIRGH